MCTPSWVLWGKSAVDFDSSYSKCAQSFLWSANNNGIEQTWDGGRGCSPHVEPEIRTPSHLRLQHRQYSQKTYTVRRNINTHSVYLLRSSSPSPHQPGRTADPSSLAPCPLPPPPPRRCCTPPWSPRWRSGWSSGEASPSASPSGPSPPAPHFQSPSLGLDWESGRTTQEETQCWTISQVCQWYLETNPLLQTQTITSCRCHVDKPTQGSGRVTRAGATFSSTSSKHGGNHIMCDTS